MFHANLKTNKQAGFSLVELMVVVAIIGILAAMSVGQIGKQVAKARQSEVKANLANLYTAMKTFQGEFGAFYGEFTALGFGVEGQVRYDVGFTATGPKPGSYTTADAAVMKSRLSALCGGVGSAAASTAPPCTLVATNGVNPTAPATTPTATTFTAQGSAFIFAAANNDQWTINEIKTLTNSIQGIP